MKDNEKKVEKPETEETEGVKIPDEKMKKVSGGGWGDDIPRVPEYPIDDDAKNKFKK